MQDVVTIATSYKVPEEPARVWNKNPFQGVVTGARCKSSPSFQVELVMRTWGNQVVDVDG